MVLPRWRDEGEALRERFRRETEMRLRSRRFYWEVQYVASDNTRDVDVLYVWE